MRRWIALVVLSTLSLWQAPALSQARVYSQGELDALLAPVALYPDAVISHILVAATYPEELREAAAWSRANAHLSGEEAVRAAEPMPWHPSVKALLAFPDVLARMDESPQWVADLGTAFREQEPYVMDTVQALRRRAQASGMAPADQQWVPYGESIGIYPVHPHVVYLPYYNPYVVYGPWWWPSYRPVYWRPWHPRPAVFFSAHFFRGKVDWHRRHVVRHHVHHHHHHNAPVHHAPVTIHNHAHHPRPIVQGARVHAAPTAPVQRPQVRREHRVEHAQPIRPIAQSIREALPQASAQQRRHFQPPAAHAPAAHSHGSWHRGGQHHRHR